MLVPNYYCVKCYLGKGAQKKGGKKLTNVSFMYVCVAENGENPHPPSPTFFFGVFAHFSKLFMYAWGQKEKKLTFHNFRLHIHT